MTEPYPLYPVVFISYDEPMADQNYAVLKDLVPYVGRVHGVKGFDLAHKVAAERAIELGGPEVTHFFTVDGDNRLIPSEWRRLLKELATTPKQTYENRVLSWRAINLLNSLCYGNGGLKLWPIEWVRSMRTHENSEGLVKVDFCWDRSYVQMTGIVSVTDVTGSPYQAWRAGFREGVKMSLNGGKPQDKFDLANQATQLNISRFIAWASLGRDVPNGEWAILGALMGFAYVNEGPAGNEHEKIVDYDTLAAMFETVQSQGEVMRDERIYELRDVCRRFNIYVPSFGKLQSKTCKVFMQQAHKPTSSFFEVEQWEPPLAFNSA